MLTALFTGLGIGIAFWIVILPCVFFLINHKVNQKTTDETLRLMQERNDLDQERIQVQRDYLSQIRDALNELAARK